MHGFELFGVPANARFEFDTEKISNVFEHAIADAPFQLAFFMCNFHSALHRNIFFHLQASSRRRDVFEVCNSSVLRTGSVMPVESD